MPAQRHCIVYLSHTLSVAITALTHTKQVVPYLWISHDDGKGECLLFQTVQNRIFFQLTIVIIVLTGQKGKSAEGSAGRRERHN